MKFRVTTLLFFMVLCLDICHAQVERIGMRGTADFRIIGQLGNTLYAISGDGLNYYRSTDEGDTWSLFIDGLPVNGTSYTTSFNSSGTVIYFQTLPGGEHHSQRALAGGRCDGRRRTHPMGRSPGAS